jgi:hypothetical protein
MRPRAWVGTCAGRTTKRYTLSYQPGFVNDPNVGPWTQFWQVDYNSAKQQAAIATGYIDLTSRWILNKFCPVPGMCPPFPLIEWDELIPTAWWAGPAPYTPPGVLGNPVPPGQVFPVDPELPPIWATQSLPPMNCFSGPYTLRLTVEDTMGMGNPYYDTQHIWFDNKPIYGEISGILGVLPCAVINLSQIPNAGNCSVPCHGRWRYKGSPMTSISWRATRRIPAIISAATV